MLPACVGSGVLVVPWLLRAGAEKQDPFSEAEGGEVERIQRRDLAQADADLAAHPSESILLTSFPPPPKAQRAAEGREPGHCRGPKPWGDSVWPSYSTLYTRFYIKKH